MPRHSSKTLTQAELRIMQVVWRRGEATVREVADDLSEDQPVAYNTALTILGILHRKKYVRFHREGRAHIYRAVVSETEARGEAFDQLIARFFSGSKNAFAQYLLEEENIDPGELARLKNLVREKQQAKARKR